MVFDGFSVSNQSTVQTGALYAEYWEEGETEPGQARAGELLASGLDGPGRLGQTGLGCSISKKDAESNRFRTVLLIHRKHWSCLSQHGPEVCIALRGPRVVPARPRCETAIAALRSWSSSLL